MATSLTSTSVQESLQQFSKVLKNLGTCLDKANAYADTKKFEVKNVLQARLAPDQFPLTRQVQISCDIAKACAARLAGQEPPKHEDNEQTVAELKARIQKTVDYLATMKTDNFVNAEATKVPVSFMPGKYLTGPDYFVEMALPNFYFHVTTAYAIMRHNGVDLGKGDFLGTLNFRDL